jgi:ribosomal protein S18 acetylase RimI-like enzyme
MTKLNIKAAAPSEQAQAVNTIVLAFSADPAARWAYPAAHEYLTHFPAFVRAFGGRAFARGSAYCAQNAEGCAGAALWLAPGVEPDEEALVALLRSTVQGRAREEVFEVFEQMGRYHPSEPHWYLPLIGVDPARRGRGYGSALMEHALAHCDRDRTPAYLESSNPKNIPLYERHGFELLGTIQVGSSPPVFPMLRRAR